MNRFSALALLPALMLTSPLRAAADPLPLQNGEALTFRVGWGIFPSAGEIKISARSEIMEGLPQLRVTVNTATLGLVRLFYPFNDTAQSIYDARTGLLLATIENGKAGAQPSKSMAVFDYGKRELTYADYVHPEHNAVIPIPPGDPLDLLTGLVNARRWDLKPGEKVTTLVQFGDDFYPLVIYADHYETVTTPLGTFDTLVLLPRMETNPKGMFKRGGEVKVWIARNPPRLLVKFEVKVAIGTAAAVLTDYQPPAVPKNAPPRS